MEDRWFDEELSGCRLGDGRLDSRLRQLVARMELGRQMALSEGRSRRLGEIGGLRVNVPSGRGDPERVIS